MVERGNPNLLWGWSPVGMIKRYEVNFYSQTELSDDDMTSLHRFLSFVTLL